MAHINGTRHCRAVEEITQKTSGSALTNGKRGRPRSSANSGPTTKSLHSWFSSANGTGNSCESFPWDKSDIFNLMCWGFRDTSCLYGRKSYVVKGLLDDPHPGKDWYPEPHLKISFQIGQDLIQIDGSFRHRNCNRISSSGGSFDGLTCASCKRIPHELDFRMRVVREDKAIDKRGGGSTGGGRRLGCLSIKELSVHNRLITKKNPIRAYLSVVFKNNSCTFESEQAFFAASS